MKEQIAQDEFDEGKIVQAITELITKNKDWRKILVNAPGGAALRIGVAFYANRFLNELERVEKEEYREFREMLEQQLTGDELKYLAETFARMGVDKAAEHYNELLSKKDPAEQEEAKQKWENEYSKKLEAPAKQYEMTRPEGGVEVEGEGEGSSTAQPSETENEGQGEGQGEAGEAGETTSVQQQEGEQTEGAAETTREEEVKDEAVKKPKTKKWKWRGEVIAALNGKNN